MYENDLELFLADVVERGLHFQRDGFVHTHNKLDTTAPKPPMKFFLCTPELRPEARMTPDDIVQMGEFCWRYIKKHRLNVPAIAGIPRVGDEIARAIQQAAERDDINLPRLAFEKNDDGTIGRLIRSDGYTKGQPIWLVDDLTQFGISKERGIEASQKAKFPVRGILTFLDYGMAQAHFRKLNIEHHSVATVRKTLSVGLNQGGITQKNFDEMGAYLTQSQRAAN